MIFSGFICPFYILESLETSRISLSSSKPLSLKPEFFLAPVPQPKKKMKSHLKVPGLVVVEAEAPSPVSSRPETQGLVVVEAPSPVLSRPETQGLVVVEAEAPSPVSSRPETQGLVVVEAEAPSPVSSRPETQGLVVVEAEAPSPVSSRPETQGLIVVEAEAPTPVAPQSEALRSTCTSFLRPVVQGKHDKFYRLEI